MIEPMPRGRFRISLWRSMLAVAVVALFLRGCVLPVILPVVRLSQYRRVYGVMDSALKGCEFRFPPGVAPSEWECAWGWTSTAFGNICFSEEHVSLDEMNRLRGDLLAKLRGPVGPETLLWIWDRLAQTGPHGRRYVERFKPQFLECFPPGTLPAASPGGP